MKRSRFTEERLVDRRMYLRHSNRHTNSTASVFKTSITILSQICGRPSKRGALGRAHLSSP
jgi:hypothetical protein